MAPLNAGRFLEAAIRNLEPLRGTFVYAQVVRDLREKTEQADGGYSQWLDALLPWLAQYCAVQRPPRVLDFGCGSGELTVLMNKLGYEATGIDLHAVHLELARILAEDNGVPTGRFVLHRDGPLPFADAAFDIVTMDSVFEHLSDDMLARILPELGRVCAGALFVLVPNRFKTHDDHTGLGLVNWMPRGMAAWRIRAGGPYRRYGISEDGSWDVYPRTYWAVRRRLARCGFHVEFVPDRLVYPPLEVARPVYDAGVGRGWRSPLLAPARAALRTAVATGVPRQAFYPYLNLVATPAHGAEGPERERVSGDLAGKARP